MSDELRRLACVSQHGGHYFPAPDQWECLWCRVNLIEVHDGTKEPFVSDEAGEKRYVRRHWGDTPRHLKTKATRWPEWLVQ